MGAVSLYNIVLRTEYAERWLATPEIFYAMPVPVITGALALLLLRSLAKSGEAAPFACSLGLFLIGMAGLGITIFPDIVPPSITIWDAAAPERSQSFMLIGVAITMPLILAYTAWAYWVFRGKVDQDGYH